MEQVIDHLLLHTHLTLIILQAIQLQIECPRIVLINDGRTERIVLGMFLPSQNLPSHLHRCSSPRRIVERGIQLAFDHGLYTQSLT